IALAKLMPRVLAWAFAGAAVGAAGGGLLGLLGGTLYGALHGQMGIALAFGASFASAGAAAGALTGAFARIFEAEGAWGEYGHYGLHLGKAARPLTEGLFAPPRSPVRFIGAGHYPPEKTRGVGPV